MKRYKFREDIAGMKESTEKTWNEKYKRRSSFFRRYHHNKRQAELCNSELFKKNPCILKCSDQITKIKKPQKKNK